MEIPTNIGANSYKLIRLKIAKLSIQVAICHPVKYSLVSSSQC